MAAVSGSSSGGGSGGGKPPSRGGGGSGPPGGDRGSGKKGRGGVDRMGIDRTGPDKMLYDSDDESCQPQRVKDLSAELHKRENDPKLVTVPGGGKARDWKTNYNHILEEEGFQVSIYYMETTGAL